MPTPTDAKAPLPQGRSKPEGKGADFTLVNVDGQPFTLSRVARPVILTFFFTACQRGCGSVVDQALALSRRLAASPGTPPPILVGVSVAPEADTRKELARFQGEHRAGPGEAVFLTGSPGALARVCRDYSVAVGRNTKGARVHAEVTLLLDAWLGLVARYDGPGIDDVLLERDISETIRRSSRRAP